MEILFVQWCREFLFICERHKKREFVLIMRMLFPFIIIIGLRLGSVFVRLCPGHVCHIPDAVFAGILIPCWEP